jgi:hypothetical protein
MGCANHPSSFSWIALNYASLARNIIGHRAGGHGKEVEGNDHLTMVSEEVEPMFGSIAASVADTWRLCARRPRSRAFRSSPWIFGAPQSAFSAAMRRMRVRICSLTLGRPAARLRAPRRELGIGRLLHCSDSPLPSTLRILVLAHDRRRIPHAKSPMSSGRGFT